MAGSVQWLDSSTRGAAGELVTSSFSASIAPHRERPRAAFSAAASMTPSHLQHMLTSGEGFVADPMAYGVASELVEQLEAEGLLVERHEMPLD